MFSQIKCLLKSKACDVYMCVPQKEHVKYGNGYEHGEDVHKDSDESTTNTRALSSCEKPVEFGKVSKWLRCCHHIVVIVLQKP